MKLIKTIRDIILESSDNTQRIKNIMYPIFDKLFDKSTIQADDDEYVYWYKEGNKDKILYEKNFAGRLWVVDCEEHKKLFDYSRFISMDYDSFSDLLVAYLNGKYGHIFPKRLIRSVSLTHCSEDEFDFGLTENTIKRDIEKVRELMYGVFDRELKDLEILTVSIGPKESAKVKVFKDKNYKTIFHISQTGWLEFTNCDLLYNLKRYSKFLSVYEEVIEKLIMEYINERYKDDEFEVINLDRTCDGW